MPQADRSGEPDDRDLPDATSLPGGAEVIPGGAHEDAGDLVVAAPCLGVAGAARGLGVATATLRSWERRYGIAPSMHTPGGHRRYSPEDLARLQVMHRLLHEGVPPAEAARVAMRTPVDALVPAEGGTDGPAAPGDLLDGGEAAAAPPGGGRVLALPRRTARARGLARAAMALDSASCRRTLTAAMAGCGAAATWDELIRPVLAAIGDRWESTGRGVEVEHSFSVVVTGVLAGHQGTLERARNDRPVLLASVPAELHDLPLLALQAALADLGVRCHLIGARTPHDALVDAVVRLGPPVVFLWAQVATSWEPELPPLRPAPTVILGGPGWPATSRRTPHPRDLPAAVAAVSAAMGL